MTPRIQKIVEISTNDAKTKLFFMTSGLILVSLAYAAFLFGQNIRDHERERKKLIAKASRRLQNGI